MAERPRPSNEPGLEEALVDLGRALDYPRTPDLAGRVTRRLAGRPAAPPAPFGLLSFRRLLFTALLVVILAGAFLGSAGLRNGLAGRLGLRGVDIVHVPSVPTATAPTRGSATTTSPPVGEGLDLGERLRSLDEARARVPYSIVAPTLSELATPDGLYLRPTPPGGQLALVYRAGPSLPDTPETGVGLLFTQFQADLAPAFFGKGLGPESRVEQVPVNGSPGYWIEGRPHFFFYRDERGRVADERLRLASNVLLWESRGLTLRLEAAIGKDDALRIAASIR